jgi:hypothetical protein
MPDNIGDFANTCVNKLGVGGFLLVVFAGGLTALCEEQQSRSKQGKQDFVIQFHKLKLLNSWCWRLCPPHIRANLAQTLLKSD